MAERNRKATIEYLNGDGAETKLTAGDVAALQFKFEGGEDRILAIGDLSDFVRTTAMVRGIAEKVRDSYAGAKSPQEALEWADSVIEYLMAGEWSERKEGVGPSLSLFVQAVQAVKSATAAKRGTSYDAAADLPALREKYIGKDKAKVRETALAGNAALRAALDALEADAAEARARAKREAAAKSAAAAGADGTAADL